MVKVSVRTQDVELPQWKGSRCDRLRRCINQILNSISRILHAYHLSHWVILLFFTTKRCKLFIEKKKTKYVWKFVSKTPHNNHQKQTTNGNLTICCSVYCLTSDIRLNIHCVVLIKLNISVEWWIIYWVYHSINGFYPCVVVSNRDREMVQYFPCILFSFSWIQRCCT